MINVFKILKNPKGVSLVETLIVVLIFSFIIAGLYSTSAVGDSSWQTNRTLIELHQELRKAMDYMVSDLRQAGPSTIANIPVGATTTTIVFKTPTGITGGSLTWSGNNVQYALGGPNNDQILRSDGVNTNIVAQYMQTMQFTRQAGTPDILDIALVAQRNTLKGLPIQTALNFSIQLRNK